MRTRSQATREAVLTATVQLLSQREFADIGTGEIARSAGVSEGTIFRYFPTKIHLYRAIVEEQGAKFFASVDDELARIGQPLGKLEFLTGRLVDFVLEHRDLLWIIHRDSTFSRGPAGEPCYDGLRRFVGHVESILRQGASDGAFGSDVDPRAGAFLLPGMVHAMLLEDRLYRDGKGTARVFRERARAYSAILMRGFIAGGRP